MQNDSGRDVRTWFIEKDGEIGERMCQQIFALFSVFTLPLHQRMRKDASGVLIRRLVYLFVVMAAQFFDAWDHHFRSLFHRTE